MAHFEIHNTSHLEFHDTCDPHFHVRTRSHLDIVTDSPTVDTLHLGCTASHVNPGLTLAQIAEGFRPPTAAEIAALDGIAHIACDGFSNACAPRASSVDGGGAAARNVPAPQVLSGAASQRSTNRFGDTANVQNTFGASAASMPAGTIATSGASWAPRSRTSSLASTEANQVLRMCPLAGKSEFL